MFDDDTLTWVKVVRTSEVGEISKQTRATTSRIPSKDSTSTSLQLIDEEKAGYEKPKEDAERYKSVGDVQCCQRRKMARA